MPATQELESHRQIAGVIEKILSDGLETIFVHLVEVEDHAQRRGPPRIDPIEGDDLVRHQLHVLTLAFEARRPPEPLRPSVTSRS